MTEENKIQNQQKKEEDKDQAKLPTYPNDNDQNQIPETDDAAKTTAEGERSEKEPKQVPKDPQAASKAQDTGTNAVLQGDEDGDGHGDTATGSGDGGTGGTGGDFGGGGDTGVRMARNGRKETGTFFDNDNSNDDNDASQTVQEQSGANEEAKGDNNN